MGLLSDKQLGKGKNLKQGDLGIGVPQITGPTGSILLPGGTTVQRDAAPVNGLIRHNSQIGQIEVYVNGGWEGLDGGAAAEAAAANALISANNAAADAITTAADVVLTNADVVQTGLDAAAADASAIAAANAESGALAAFDQFDDIYLGAKASDPTLDNDGNALVVGALHWNTTLDVLRVYNGTFWEDAGISVAAVSVTFNNVVSGLVANNIQDAIDEVEARLDTAESTISTNTSNIGSNDTDISNLQSTKANLASPALTGTPTAPTAAANDNTTKIATTAYVQGELGDMAPLASPAFTGNPTSVTPAPGDNDTSIATTAFVKTAGDLKANLASPVLTGTPLAPNAAASTNTTQIATTAFVQTELADYVAKDVTSEVLANVYLRKYVPTHDLSGLGGATTLAVHQGTPAKGAFMEFTINGQYGIHFGLDGITNKLSVGGYYLGAYSYAIYHEGNKQTTWGTSAKTTSTSAASGGADGDFWFQY